jgi:hypothetical protein
MRGRGARGIVFVFSIPVREAEVLLLMGREVELLLFAGDLEERFW